jgi:nucleotide-binding universal stress UspA family protein
MTTLIPVDGSQSSQDALSYAAHQDPHGDVLLLHVSPSGRQGDLARGRFLLETSERACKQIAAEVHVRLRLEVGNAADKLREAAESCDRVVLGAHGVNALPRIEEAGRETCPEPRSVGRPVVMVLPSGDAVAAD